jgi:hypothetical protein
MHDAIPYLDKQDNPVAYLKTVIGNRIKKVAMRQGARWDSHDEEMPLDMFVSRDWVGGAEAQIELDRLASTLTGSEKEVFNAKVQLWQEEKKVTTKAIAGQLGIHRVRCAKEVKQAEARL